jgi:D-alanyl-D-alanine endopeptidase (penicillin-binding protein 7)
MKAEGIALDRHHAATAEHRSTIHFATLGVFIVAGLVSASAAAQSTDTLELASVHAVVGKLSNGEILHAKRDDRPVPIASLSKLMTAMVVLDAGQPLDEWIPILKWSESHGKNRYSRLRVGSEATRGELLRITLMSSENLAAHTLARQYPGGLAAFVASMNAKAAELGMLNSKFDDPTGLSTQNRSTAADLFKMATAAYRYDTIREFSTTYQRVVSFRKPRTTLAYGNTNPLTASSRWDVEMSKTGYLTEAGRCLVMVAEIDQQAIVIVLLNSFGTRTPLGDAGRIRRWLQTGASSRIASAARDYERRVAASFEPSEPATPSQAH